MSNVEKIEKLTLKLENLNTFSIKIKNDNDIIKQSREASSYLLSHDWCLDIVDGWLGLSWGYILGVFLYRLKSNNPNVDEYIWMVVGDIPPAYIDIESAADPLSAIRCYVDIMNDWVEAVEDGKSIENCYPIEVPANLEYASMLKSRIKLISEEVSKES